MVCRRLELSDFAGGLNKFTLLPTLSTGSETPPRHQTHARGAVISRLRPIQAIGWSIWSTGVVQVQSKLLRCQVNASSVQIYSGRAIHLRDILGRYDVSSLQGCDPDPSAISRHKSTRRQKLRPPKKPQTPGCARYKMVSTSGRRTGVVQIQGPAPAPG
jgi:hypothetical protein